jgi:hypothetical protein
VSLSSEFSCHNLLCCFSTSNSKDKHIFRYRLSPKSFGYTLVQILRPRNEGLSNLDGGGGSVLIIHENSGLKLKAQSACSYILVPV